MTNETTLDIVSKKMRKLDICMLTTKTAKGFVTSRPMSNNGDVEYDGNSWFFTYDKSRTVEDIAEDAQVNLNFTGPDKLYISLTGKAQLITDKAVLQQHWIDELKQWFDKGLDTPGITLIHVKADRIKFWQKEEEGEVKL